MLIYRNYTPAHLLCAENLLINPDFSINQREKVTYTGSLTYTVDRWKFNDNNDNILTVSDEYITLSVNNADESFREIQQKIERTAKLKGKNLVVSALVRSNSTFVLQVRNNGHYVVRRSRISEQDSKWHHISLPFTFPQDGTNLDARIGFYGNGTLESKLDIAWVKLEIGDYPTQFVIPNISTELIKCKRYYQRINGATFRQSNFYNGNHYLTFHDVFNTAELRIASPTCSFKNGTLGNWHNGYGIVKNDASAHVSTGYSKVEIAISENMAYLKVLMDNTFPTLSDAIYLFFIRGGCFLEIDAEMY